MNSSSILGNPQYTGVYNAANYSQAYSDPGQNPIIGPELKTSHMYGGKRKTNRVKKTKTCLGGAWSNKYKKSINCKKPKGFSQRQHCKYGRGGKSKRRSTTKQSK